MILYWHSGNQNIEWVIVVVTPSDQIIMMSSLNKTVTHEVRFWCYFTETTVHRTCVCTWTQYTNFKSTSLCFFSLPDPPWIFFFTWSSVDLFLYLILRGSFSLPDPPWIFFFTWSSVDLFLYLILRAK